MKLKIWNRTDQGNREVGQIIEHDILPHAGAFAFMRGSVEISLHVDYDLVFDFIVHQADAQNPEHWYEVDEHFVKVTDTSALACVTGDFFHAVSHYAERFTGKGDCLQNALYFWHKQAIDRKIRITPNGNILFPGISFSLSYRPATGGWQPCINAKEDDTAPKVYRADMPEPWRKAWDYFCKTNPKCLKNKNQDEARNRIEIESCDGPALEID